MIDLRQFCFHLGRLFYGAAALLLFVLSPPAEAQSIAVPWSSHGHDPQHTGISPFAAMPLTGVRWQTPVDLMPQYSGSELLIHYGSPLITRQNTVLIPVKTGTTDGFRVEAHRGTDGSLIWMQTTDYSVTSGGAYSWVPPCGLALTPANRVYFPGSGGTVYFRDGADTDPAPNSGQIAFYGLGNYLDDSMTKANFDANVKISTPITSDRYGNIFFGFQVATDATTTPPLQSGIARIDVDGTGSWISASAAAPGDAAITGVVANCAPALSNDHKTLYVAVSEGDFEGGDLVALDSRTLAPIAQVRLKDVLNPDADALLPDISTACPCVGPDGDVYFGAFENPVGANHERGWLLHFDQTLTQSKVPGAFGWDDTPSIVPANLVPSYQGTSPYLVLCKYNNYAEIGGNGANKVAILDPNVSATDPQTGATVMQEVIAVLGPTPDPDFPNVPGAVREWCINTVAVDPFSKCAIIHSEDGNVYRWTFGTNSLTETLNLTSGIGEAYTPSVIGVDGTIYVIANAILFAIGS